MFMVPFFCGFAIGCFVAWISKPSVPATLKAEARYEKAYLEAKAQKLEEENLKNMLQKNAKDFKDIKFSYQFESEANRAFNKLQNFFLTNRENYNCYKLKYKDSWNPYVILSYRIINDAPPIDFKRILR